MWKCYRDDILANLMDVAAEVLGIVLNLSDLADTQRHILTFNEYIQSRSQYSVCLMVCHICTFMLLYGVNISPTCSVDICAVTEYLFLDCVGQLVCIPFECVSCYCIGLHGQLPVFLSLVQSILSLVQNNHSYQ